MTIGNYKIGMEVYQLQVDPWRVGLGRGETRLADHDSTLIAFIFALGIMSALKVAQEEKRVLLYKGEVSLDVRLSSQN